MIFLFIFKSIFKYVGVHVYVNINIYIHTSSTPQNSGGSLKDRKPLRKVGCDAWIPDWNDGPEGCWSCVFWCFLEWLRRSPHPQRLDVVWCSVVAKGSFELRTFTFSLAKDHFVQVAPAVRDPWVTFSLAQRSLALALRDDITSHVPTSPKIVVPSWH